MLDEKIIIKGARVHNLKNIDIDIPRNKFVVVTGLSGSGKSSLAFDTIYAEGQRRYVESLSAYARQFLEQMEKPDVDYIGGLSPAIAIEQRTTAKNPRSTVGTVTEIYDYLRLLYARIGIPHCYNCGKLIRKQSVDEIVEQIMSLKEDKKLQILAPVVRGRKGECQQVFASARKDGYIRVRVDGQVHDLSEEISLKKNKNHNVEIVVDRLILKPDIRGRLSDSIEAASALAKGIVMVIVDEVDEKFFSAQMACVDCGISYEELSPRSFSFNSPYGACPECTGLGSKIEIDPDLIVPDKSKNIYEGAIVPLGFSSSWLYQIERVARQEGFLLDVPFGSLKKEQQNIILYGSSDGYYCQTKYGERYYGGYEGVIPTLNRRYKETESERVREDMTGYMTTKTCTACQGARLKKESLYVTVGEKSISQITGMSIKELNGFFEDIVLTEFERLVAKKILQEIQKRLEFLSNVGLSYLSLDRMTKTLSGGEAQRIHLATQIGSGLVGVLYVLDEPSIGLHQRDNQKLLNTMCQLRDMGNTLIVVEHDEATIRQADFIIDLGPGAGEVGGRIVAQGSLEDILTNKDSLTGKYLRGDVAIPIPAKRCHGERFLEIKGASHHNLKNITIKIPIGLFICITGVSGSGKSTLIGETLYPLLMQRLYNSRVQPGKHNSVFGLEYIDKVIDIDQSPIGRTPRSNPATYTGLFTHIRDLFSLLPEAKMKGYAPGRFSFNVKGGRCEACQGDGIIRIEMHFLPAVYVPCEVCKGKRYNKETIEVRYKGRSIADVLDMTVKEAWNFFKAIPSLYNKLQTLMDVGLSYIKLGQSAITFSGGEAQRIKLSAELSKRSTGKTLYLLDEPTTGLHFADIHLLLDVLLRLRDAGNTVIIIEHNLDVIKTADYIIDLGPEGGDEGGQVVAVGTPEEVARNEDSYTGQFLRECGVGSNRLVAE
ncbi:excinuclease ABC subunit UvrA [Candidatus Desantisbacteria bacterium CG_4_8_14_3_um_filter_40_12]|uniref:UvrABC system protein A n=1 Tax=Candidatus Desantisbacteria bacterium CG_4_8_14_3_um_filter_40_12 TaxID=1974545 RepID=A0A2M7JEZ1_9BACT|nr:MAG: excinuclease ABC subunit UvrA [Candidatus Desantisbacteria bacterium CG_4_8_14_3_um_filter_40_12]